MNVYIHINCVYIGRRGSKEGGDTKEGRKGRKDGEEGRKKCQKGRNVRKEGR